MATKAGNVSTVTLPYILKVEVCLEGRGLVATEDLSIGKEVFECRPFSYVISEGQCTSTCAHCLMRPKSLQRCSQCQFNHYCNTACQKSDWSIHKWECLGMKSIIPTRPTHLARHVLRLLCKAKSYSNSSELSSLCSNIDKVTHKKMAYFRDLGLALQTMASHANCINVTDLVLLLCQLTSNVFSILDQDLNPTGEGLFIGPSFLNHSCVPNCTIVFEGKTLSVRVISPIPSGQQLYISYVDLLGDPAKRKETLLENYFFKCTCARCRREVKTDDLLDQVKCTSKEVERLKRDLSEVESLVAQSDYESVLSKCCTVPSKVAPLVGECHWIQIRLIECAMDAAIELQRWRTAFEYGQQLTDKYRSVMGPHSPIFSLHFLKLLKLAHLIGQDSSTIGKEAIQHLTITHGTSHKLTKEAGTYI